MKNIKEALVLKHLTDKIHHYGLPIFKCYKEQDDSIDIYYEYINGLKLSDYLE